MHKVCFTRAFLLTYSCRIIAECNDPSQRRFFTLTFRAFTPTPGGLEFQPGKDYYFISTSSSTNLHNRYGGRCASHGMKAIFKIADNSIIEGYERVNVFHVKKKNKIRNKDRERARQQKLNRLINYSKNNENCVIDLICQAREFMPNWIWAF